MSLVQPCIEPKTLAVIILACAKQLLERERERDYPCLRKAAMSRMLNDPLPASAYNVPIPCNCALHNQQKLPLKLTCKQLCSLQGSQIQNDSVCNHFVEQITSEMRKTLVNWLIEVHFKFRFREPCLHLTIQLLDRYLAANVVTRRKYQTVGVTAFMLGCKYEERHNPNLGDLSYITDYSSSRQDVSAFRGAWPLSFFTPSPPLPLIAQLNACTFL